MVLVEDLVKQYIISSLEDNNVRACSECGKYIIEGYCIEHGRDYYCSDNCLEKNMSMEVFEELQEDAANGTYYTEWSHYRKTLNAIKEILNRFPEITNINIQ